MRNLLYATTAILALALAPAHATLQLSGDVNGTPFSAVDNNAPPGTILDLNPLLNSLSLGPTTVNGVVLSGSLTTALLTGPFELNSSSLSIINTNSFAVTIHGIASATNFTGPANFATVSGSGTFQNASGGTMINEWWNDPLNRQGAPGTPGTVLLLTPLFTAAGSPSSYGALNGFQGSSAVNDPGLFSETFSFTATLPGGTGISTNPLTCLGGATIACPTIVGRQQAEQKTENAPEPASLALLGAGLLGLGWAKRKRAA